MEPWQAFLLGTFSVWRITHLLHAEDGPWDVFFRLRVRLGNSFFGQLTDCFYCLSLWISAPFALALGMGFLEKFLLFWAMSGAAMVLQKITTYSNFPANPFKED